VYDDLGVSFGAGVEYYFDRGVDKDGFNIWLDYQNLLHKKGPREVNANIITAGIGYDF